MTDALDHLPVLAVWVSTMRDLEGQLKALRGVVKQSPESPLSQAIGDVQAAYTDAVAELTGLSDEHVLQPFWLECDLGDRPYKIKLKSDIAWREIIGAEGLAQLAADWGDA